LSFFNIYVTDVINFPWLSEYEKAGLIKIYKWPYDNDNFVSEYNKMGQHCAENSKKYKWIAFLYIEDYIYSPVLKETHSFKEILSLMGEQTSALQLRVVNYIKNNTADSNYTIYIYNRYPESEPWLTSLIVRPNHLINVYFSINSRGKFYELKQLNTIKLALQLDSRGHRINRYLYNTYAVEQKNLLAWIDHYEPQIYEKFSLEKYKLIIDSSASYLAHISYEMV